MDGKQFDLITRQLASTGNRRQIVKRLIGGVALALGLGVSTEVDAASCRAAGESCREAANCCSKNCLPKDRRGQRICACEQGTTPCGATCCSSGQVCDNGRCRRPTPTTTTAAPDLCAGKTGCNRAGCDPTTGECRPCATREDCSLNNPCFTDTCLDDGRCVHTPKACPGQICDPKDAICKTCLNDSGCTTTLRCATPACRDGYCVEIAKTCPQGEVCDSSDGTCGPGTCNGCNDGAGCGPHGSCSNACVCQCTGSYRGSACQYCDPHASDCDDN